MSQATMFDTLAGIRFLNDIPRKNLAQIAPFAEVREFRESETVFREGEAAECVYFVISGMLSLELSPSTIYRKCLVRVGPGEMLGWSSLVEDSRFVATAVVVEPARLVRISAAPLRKLCNDDPQFGCEFMRRTMLALAKRLTTTWTQLAKLYIAPNLPVTAGSDD
jgi:CRP-like cAMP-binding protein